MKCCIKGCDSSNHKTEGVNFFNFPRSTDQRHKKWVENIGTENIISSGVLSICSKHFEPDMINRTLTIARLKEHAIPTIFPFILTAAELNNSSAPQMTKDEPRKALTLVIDAGVCKGVVAEQTSNTEANADKYEVHVHVPREPDSNNTSPRIDRLVPKRHFSSMSTDVDENNILPQKKYILSSSASYKAGTIQHLTKLVNAQRKKIKTLNRAKLRLHKKVITFKNVIDELKKNCEMSKEHAALAEESQKYLSRQITKWGRQKKV